MANYPYYNYIPQPTQTSGNYVPQPMLNQPQAYQPTPYQPQYPMIPQTQQPQSLIPTVRGRVISREEDIMPNEVVMDGQVSLFPLSDYSCIVAKLWDSNGQIQTFKFVPLAEEVVEKQLEDKSDMILGRLDDIESLLKKNGSRQSYKKNQNGSRNEERDVDNA